MSAAPDTELDALLVESVLEARPRIEAGKLVAGNTTPAPGSPKPYDPTKSIAKTNYSHEAMIDLIIANPGINQGEMARHFGYTEGWVSRVLASDAFQQALDDRKAVLVDPVIRATIEERFKALVYRSMDVVMRKLDEGAGADVALKGLELGAKALGYGARDRAPQVNVHQSVIVVPAKAVSTEEWQKAHVERPLPAIIEQRGGGADALTPNTLIPTAKVA
jgi:hypothetical protein